MLSSTERDDCCWEELWPGPRGEGMGESTILAIYREASSGKEILLSRLERLLAADELEDMGLRPLGGTVMTGEGSRTTVVGIVGGDVSCS